MALLAISPACSPSERPPEPTTDKGSRPIYSPYYYLKNVADDVPDKQGRVQLFVDSAEDSVWVAVDSVQVLHVFPDGADTLFPTAVFNFKNLRFLWLGMRAFERVPGEIASLDKLEVLDFQHGALRS